MVALKKYNAPREMLHFLLNGEFSAKDNPHPEEYFGEGGRCGPLVRPPQSEG